MSDKTTNNAADEDVQAAAQVDGRHGGAPTSKLALAGLVISVLALVVRCQGATQRQHDHVIAAPTSVADGPGTVMHNLQALEAMSASLAAKARQAHDGAWAAADCDHTAYEQFLASRNSLAAQLDASAPALGAALYVRANEQLVALAMSAASSSELLTAACDAAPRQLFRRPTKE